MTFIAAIAALSTAKLSIVGLDAAPQRVSTARLSRKPFIVRPGRYLPCFACLASFLSFFSFGVSLGLFVFAFRFLS